MTDSEPQGARTPDMTFRCGRISVVGWRDENKGWSLQLSRSYLQNDETRYEQMRLFAADLPVASALLQKATESLLEH